MLIFSMFRGNDVGTDTQNYIDATHYEIEFDIEKTSTYEITFLTICNIINKTGLPDRTIIVFFSLYTFFMLWLACKKFRINICLACLFFYFSFYISSFNESRQIAACMTIFAAYSYYIKDKNITASILLILLATSLHLSSLLFLIVPFLLVLSDKIPKNIALLFMLAALIIFRIFDFDLFKGALTLLLDLDLKYVSSYGDLFEDDGGGFSIYAVISFFLEYIIIVYIIKTNNPQKDNLTPMEFLFVLGYLFLCFMSPAHMYIKRISYGLSLFAFLFYADYYQKHLKSRGFTLTNMIFISHIALYTYILLSKISSNSNGVLPYEFV